MREGGRGRRKEKVMEGKREGKREGRKEKGRKGSEIHVHVHVCNVPTTCVCTA